MKITKLIVGILNIAAIFSCSWSFAQSNAHTLTQVRLGINGNSESNDRRLTRNLTRSGLNRDIFASCYASVPLVYGDGTATWNLLITTDPIWNRLIYGDYDRWIKSYGSWGTGNGQFRHPLGIDRNSYGKIFVADMGNNRVVALQMNMRQIGRTSTYTTYPSYLTSITGLSIPHDVAWDDNGTPTNTADDYLWIVDTGNDRILKYRFYDNNTFSLDRTYGSSGTGTGKFRNPKAIAVGRTSGVNNNEIYVADATNQRIVWLVDGSSSISWAGTYTGSLVDYTSVHTDWYGGVWVTDAKNHKIFKLDWELNLLDTYGTYGLGQVYGYLNSPNDFSIYYSLEKINGVNTWIGHDATFVVESWGDNAGGVCYEMGTHIKSVVANLQPCGPPLPKVARVSKVAAEQICPIYCTYFLTDYSRVTITVHRQSNNQLIRTVITNQTRVYEQHSEFWDGKNDQGQVVTAVPHYFKVTATSLYTGATPVVKSSSSFTPQFGSQDLVDAQDDVPTEYALLPNTPNPFNPQTWITYQLPVASHVKIIIFDLLGRRVRELVDENKEAGTYRVQWDGRNEDGYSVGSGLYFYRMQSGSFAYVRKMTFIK